MLVNIFSIPVFGLRFAFKPNIADIANSDLDLPVREDSGTLDALSYGRMIV